MGNLVDIAALAPFDVWGEAVRARQVQGDRVAFALVELAPDALVPEHRHEQEQLGMVIEGQVRFRIDQEVMDLGPGGTWRIPSNHPHEIAAGPDGAVVIDIFSPLRADWERFTRLEPRPPRWPPRG
jgi:quercetin dioxygenase-like cupin family protein